MIDSRLDDFLDGVLPPLERVSIEAHLAQCAQCRAEAEGLRRVIARARSLPPSVQPSRDLWPAIAAEMSRDASHFPALPRAETGRLQRSRYARPGLAAAALLLVALSSLVTWRIAREGHQSAGADPSAAMVAGTAATLVELHGIERDYQLATADLAATLETRRASLDPATVALVEADLRVIDQAIREARAALLADPTNEDLPRMLSTAYRHKLELLQQATRL
ncbi:MAG: zf-HC2 domain-containing protein [Gemmatimonadota bacterium]|nr:zf-HC2 domain-containing protein [Gemmatimonadota bacterium]